MMSPWAVERAVPTPIWNVLFQTTFNEKGRQLRSTIVIFIALVIKSNLQQSLRPTKLIWFIDLMLSLLLLIFSQFTNRSGLQRRDGRLISTVLSRPLVWWHDQTILLSIDRMTNWQISWLIGRKTKKIDNHSGYLPNSKRLLTLYRNIQFL